MQKVFFRVAWLCAAGDLAIVHCFEASAEVSAEGDVKPWRQTSQKTFIRSSKRHVSATFSTDADGKPELLPSSESPVANTNTKAEIPANANIDLSVTMHEASIQAQSSSSVSSTLPLTTTASLVSTTPTSSTATTATHSAETTKRSSDQCFPSDATVSVLLKGLEAYGPAEAIVTRRVDQLRIGDKVLGAKGFTKVFAFMDHNHDLIGEYLHLQTTEGSSLSLSAEHIIFAHNDKIPVFARSLIGGDIIWLVEKQKIGPPSLLPAQIAVVSWTKEFGLHAPLTEEGTLVVNSILASSYAGVETIRWGSQTLFTGHEAARLAHMPLLSICSSVPWLCEPSWHSPDLGRHVWTQWLLDHLGWLRALNLAHADLEVAVVVRPTLTSLVAAVVQVFAVGALTSLEWASAQSLQLVLVVAALLVAMKSTKPFCNA